MHIRDKTHTDVEEIFESNSPANKNNSTSFSALCNIQFCINSSRKENCFFFFFFNSFSKTTNFEIAEQVNALYSLKEIYKLTILLNKKELIFFFHRLLFLELLNPLQLHHSKLKPRDY